MRFEEELVRDLTGEIDKRFEENRHLSSRRLQTMLHEFAVEQTRRRFDRWRNTEDDRVARAFRAVCDRLGARLDRAVDDLFRFASDLFDVPYEAIRAEALWNEGSGFYYKFWDESTSLTLLASSAVLALPKLIGARLLLKRAREDASKVARTQSGRVRWDFQQRLERSALAFERRMSDNVEAVLQGLERALGRGAALRRTGRAEAERRSAEIASSLAALDAVQTKLRAVLDAVEPGERGEPGERVASE